MDYSPIFAFAVRTERSYTAAQDWITNDAPVLEQRLKVSALKTAITVLETMLAIIDWAIAYIDSELPIQIVRLQLFTVKTKQRGVRLLIKVARFNERYQITAKASAVWSRKGQLAVTVMDRIFCLNG